MSSYHVPVLLNESIEALQIKPGGIYVDATLGGGGHTEKILQTNGQIKLFSFDQDRESLEQTKPLTEKYDNLTIIKDNFANLRTCLALERIKKIDGILFDLGVSSHQIDAAERGFSFSLEGKLDMRMNEESELTAFDIINKFEPRKLKIFSWNTEKKKKPSKSLEKSSKPERSDK